MSTITLETIEAKQSELAQLIAKFKAEQPRVLIMPSASIELAIGEHYAGLILGEDGKPSHHLILLPGDAGDLNFEQAKAWAKERGGDLPYRNEQSLLFANLKGEFEGAWYWSCQEHETNTSYAWLQSFITGNQYTGHKLDEFRARALRRLVIE